ncbi:Myb-like domain-containing protein [Entamoeba marina]
MSWTTVEQLVLVEAIQYSLQFNASPNQHWKLVSDVVTRTLSCCNDFVDKNYSDVSCYDQYVLLEKMIITLLPQPYSYLDSLDSWLRNKRIEELDKEMEQTKQIISKLQQTT